MGAKAGRKGGRSYNILTCGVGAWRKYLDKTRRKTAKRAAIEEQEITCGYVRPGEYWCHCGTHLDCKKNEEDPKCPCDSCRCVDPDHARIMYDIGEDPECTCCLIISNKEACRCGCGCCPEDRADE